MVYRSDSDVYKLENDEIVRISKEEHSSFDAKVISDKNGDIWFGVERKGVCRFANNDYECFDANGILAGDSIRDIFSDREGTIWVATNANGLFRLTKQFISPLYTDETSVGKNVYPILEDKSGAVWIGTSQGLSVFKDGKFTDYRESKQVTIQSLCEDRDGRLWVGSVNHGLFLFEDGKFHETQEKFNFSLARVDGLASVHDIHQDINGVLWFASNTGLYSYDGEKLNRLTTADGLPGENVKVILESRDGKTLWVATYGGLAAIRDGKINAWTEQNGLTGNHIRSLFEDEHGNALDRHLRQRFVALCGRQVYQLQKAKRFVQ